MLPGPNFAPFDSAQGEDFFMPSEDEASQNVNPLNRTSIEKFADFARKIARNNKCGGLQPDFPARLFRTDRQLFYGVFFVFVAVRFFFF
jgi:hypothetical protein